MATTGAERDASWVLWCVCFVTGICASFSIMASLLFMSVLAMYGGLLEHVCPGTPALGFDVRVVGGRGRAAGNTDVLPGGDGSHDRVTFSEGPTVPSGFEAKACAPSTGLGEVVTVGMAVDSNK